MLAILDIGAFELLILAAAAVLLFGGDLPDAARKAARALGRLRALTSDLTREMSDPPEPPPADRAALPAATASPVPPPAGEPGDTETTEERAD